MNVHHAAVEFVEANARHYNAVETLEELKGHVVPAALERPTRRVDELRAELNRATMQLEVVVLEEREEEEKARVKRDAMKARADRADTIGGEPVSTKFARVWGSLWQRPDSARINVAMEKARERLGL